MDQQLIEDLWYDAARRASEDPIETRHVFAALVAEECAKTASMFSIDKQPIHPDIAFDEMSDAAQGVCHSTCQCVADAIRAKFPLPPAAP